MRMPRHSFLALLVLAAAGPALAASNDAPRIITDPDAPKVITSASPAAPVVAEEQVSALVAPDMPADADAAVSQATDPTEPVVVDAASAPQQPVPAPTPTAPEQSVAPAPTSTAPESAPAPTSVSSPSEPAAALPAAPMDSITERAAPSSACVPAFAPGNVDYTLRIQPGDLVSERLTEWAGYRGYTLSWEAPQYRAEGALTLDKGLDDTLKLFKSGMDVHGINLDITIYQNCVIRIVEVK